MTPTRSGLITSDLGTENKDFSVCRPGWFFLTTLACYIFCLCHPYVLVGKSMWEKHFGLFFENNT